MLDGSTGTMMVSARRTSSVQFGAMHAGRRIDHQNIGGPRDVPQAVFISRDAADGRQIGRALRKPVQAGSLGIVVRDADLMTIRGEEDGDVGGQCALSATAFRVQNHDMTHNPPALLFSVR